MNENNAIIHLKIPRWAIYLYGLMAVVLVPWILVLAEYLPNRHLDRNWDPLWVGFDIMELIAILLCIYFIVRKSIWIVMSATALATLQFVDAWFDIMTSRPGRQQRQAILLGIIEVSLAILTYRLVYHILHKSTTAKKINMRAANKASFKTD